MTVETVQVYNGLAMMLIGGAAGVMMLWHAFLIWRARTDSLARRLFWIPLTDALIMATTFWGGYLLYNQLFHPQFWLLANGSQWVVATVSAIATLGVLHVYMRRTNGN